MDDDQLADANRKLREFASENGMQWVLAEVDEAVSLGFFEIREIRQSTRMGRTFYEDVTDARSVRGRRRTEEFVSRRPMTEREQIGLLIASLRRVLVNLDEVAAASVAVLNDPELREQAASPVTSGVETGIGNQLSFQTGPTGGEPAGTEESTRPELPVIEEISFFPDEGSSSPVVSTAAARGGERQREMNDILAKLEEEIRQ